MVVFGYYRSFRCGYGAAAAAIAATRRASRGRGRVSRAGRAGAARGARAARAARARGGAPRGAAVTCRRGTPAAGARPRASRALPRPLKAGLALGPHVLAFYRDNDSIAIQTSFKRKHGY